MSVATQLGLDDPENDVLALARQSWSTWQVGHEPLRVVDDLLDLPAWLRGADRAEADRVLLALAELSSPEGGDDVCATGALVWLLLPGASLLAYRLSGLYHRIDHLLAAQLWVQARTFSWQRGQKVAANILMNTRKGVMRDLGVGDHAGATWARSKPLPPDAEVWLEFAQRDHDDAPSPEVELAQVLEWACSQGVVAASDRELLLDLAQAADRAETTRCGRGYAGLMGPAASEAVAAARGISARTVRRRALLSVQALRAVCTAQAKVRPDGVHRRTRCGFRWRGDDGERTRADRVVGGRGR